MNNFWKYLLSYNTNKLIIDKFDDIEEDVKKEIEVYRIKNSGDCSLIYNPLGSDCIVEYGKAVYIQGKPRGLNGMHCKEITVVNSKDIAFDRKWFAMNIEPFGIVNKVDILYL